MIFRLLEIKTGRSFASAQINEDGTYEVLADEGDILTDALEILTMDQHWSGVQHRGIALESDLRQHFKRPEMRTSIEQPFTLPRVPRRAVV